MPRYAVFFSKSYAMDVEANSEDEAHAKAFDTFVSEEADANSTWEIENFIDKLED